MRLQMKKKRIRINGEKESCVFLFFPRRLAKRAGALKTPALFLFHAFLEDLRNHIRQ